MKIGQIEKGKIRFIACDKYSSVTKFGKVYESDENGTIELEGGYTLYTYADHERFIEQAECFIGQNAFIEIKDMKQYDKTIENVRNLKYGDLVQWGDDDRLFVFLTFCRNAALIQSAAQEEFIMDVPVYWLRKVGVEHEKKEV